MSKPDLQYIDKMYHGVIDVDEKTGKPADYDTLFAAYKPLVMTAAERLKIPYDEREDAVQEVQLKFWSKNGLGMYDSAKGTKFATLYRKWTSMFLLQERDKSHRWMNRNAMMGDTRTVLEDEKTELDSFEDAVLAEESMSQWARNALRGLESLERPDLVNLFKLCLVASEASRAPSRAEIAKVTGCHLQKATPLIKELRFELTRLGYGIESLFG